MMLCLRRNAQNHNPPSKLTYKRHILRMSTIPRNDLDRLQLCRLTNMLLTSTQPKILLLGPTRVVRPTRVVPDQRPLNGHCCCCCWAVFLGFAKPLCKNLEISHKCILQHTNSVLMFQTRSKSVQGEVSERRHCIDDRIKNTFWCHLGATSRNFFYANVLHGLIYISGFIQIRSGLGDL